FANRNLDYYQNIYDAFHEDGSVRFLVAEVNVDDTIARYEKLKADSEKTLEKLNTKKAARPDTFNGDGQINEMEMRISSSIRKIEEMTALKEKYGNPIILSGNMDMFWGNREVVSVYGGNNQELFMFNSAYAMYFEMIAYAAREGYERFNFYGIPNHPLDKDDEMYGVFEHKRGYNGRVERYLGEFDIPIQPTRYKLYKTLLKLRNNK
ncbi:MAG: peptidoglycan bridge formation glycyltransferase FemA/FemB family protein, partial [Solobacterium sp.]|nr:peptidoglycan bridge formation glycyltransferase FemA/FemB family protein [Solobacterium sp.]